MDNDPTSQIIVDIHQWAFYITSFQSRFQFMRSKDFIWKHNLAKPVHGVDEWSRPHETMGVYHDPCP